MIVPARPSTSLGAGRSSASPPLNWMYWATPARAAEILVGCLAAFVAADRELSPRWHLVAVAAFGALVVSFVVFRISR